MNIIFAENLQANLYSVNCRASIIKWQYVTFKTNNDALEEYVGHLATKIPKEFPDTHAFTAELEVLKSFFNSLTEENLAEVSKTIECTAKICSDSFPSVHRTFNLFRTAPPYACKSERSFSRLKLLNNYFRKRMSQKLFHYLMLMSCDKELYDGLDFNIIANKWIEEKRHRIQF